MISFKLGDSGNYRSAFHRIFGDDYDFIDTVLASSNEIFEIYENDVFCGGLCVLDVSIKVDYSIKSGAYIYGAFICGEHRGKGLFKKLCDHVREFYKDEFYDFLLTIPADEALFSLYEHLGFTSLVYGIISLSGEYTGLILPQGTLFSDFDGDFQGLYFMHVENDVLLKTFDFFKRSVSEFDIKYIEYNGERGYALLRDGAVIYASASFAKYSTKKKGLVQLLTDFALPKDFLCDILFEI